MKAFCKIAALTLAILTLLSLAACTPKKQEGDEKKQDTVDLFADKPTFDGKRFDGETVKFFINGGEGGPAVRSIVLTEKDDVDYEVNAATKERNDRIKKDLGVEIELAGTCDMQQAYEVLPPILSSHIYTYDVLGLYQYFDLGLALNDTVGSFYNYLQMPEGSYINVDAPYWNRALFDTLSYKGAAFFITGDMNQSNCGTMFVSFVNKKLWEQYKETIKGLAQNNPEGLDSVYDLVKKGYWTMDLWMDLSKMAYIDSNANLQRDYEDQAGLLTYNADINNMMMDMFAAGANVRYSKLDNGVPVMTVNSKANLEFANKLYQLVAESDAVNMPFIYTENEEDNLYIMDVFARGNVLMTVNCLNAAEEYLADMTDDYYVLPLPLYDRNQYDPNAESLGYATQLGDSVSQYAICKDAGDERLPVITATMELMGYYSMKLVTPVYFDKALKDRYTRNPEDKEMIDLTRKGIYCEFGTAWSNSLGNITWFFRDHYDQNKNMARLLKQKQDDSSFKLKSLLKAIQEAFYVE